MSFFDIIFNDTPENKEIFIMKWIRFLISRGGIGIVFYGLIIFLLKPYNETKLWLLFTWSLILWIPSILLSICYWNYSINKDKLKKEENKMAIEENKKVLAEEYKSIIKTFYLFMGRYQKEQIWKKLGNETNTEPKEVGEVFDRFREFDKMLDAFLASLGQKDKSNEPNRITS